MQKLPFLIPFRFRKRYIDQLKPKLLEKFGEVLDSDNYTNGAAILELEKSVCAFIGTKYAIAVSSAEEAAYITLAACGLRLGEEIISNPFCSVAIVRAVDRLAGQLKFIDIDEDTYTMNEPLCEQAINANTRAVMTLYPYGEAWNKGAVRKLTQNTPVVMIEEITQAFGGWYNGTRVGSQSNVAIVGCHQAATFSSLGDAGIILTNEETLAGKARLIRAEGFREMYWQRDSHAPYRYRMDEFQAAVLILKLQTIESEIARRKEVFELYTENLQTVKGLKIPLVSKEIRPSYSIYTVRALNGKRDQVVEQMLDAGIEVKSIYELPMRRGVWASESRLKHLRKASEISGQVINLPCDAYMENSEVETVAATLVKCLST